DRHGDVDLPCRGDNAVGDVVAARDPAEEVEEDDPDGGIGGDDAEGVDHLLGVRRPTDVQEVGRLSPVVLDEVHGRHGQAGTVHAAADVAVQLDEGEPRLPRRDLGGRLGTLVAQRFDL